MVAILITVHFSTSTIARVSIDKTQIPWTAQRTTCIGSSTESNTKHAGRAMHGFLGGSSEELAAACAASADLAAQRRGNPGRMPSSRCAAREQPHMRRHHALDGLRRRCRAKSSPHRLTHSHDEACEPNGHAFMASRGVYLFLRQFLAL